VSYPVIFLVTGPDGHWHPGIGDPTFLGWLTVAAYVVAAWLSAKAWRRSRSRARSLARSRPADASEESHLAALFAIVFAAMVLLGINKQLDLQTLLTDVMRDVAHRQGWYESRRKYQALFVVAIAILGAIGTAILAFGLRRSLRRVRLVVLGLGAIATFVVIRAASFHHIDALLVSGPLPLNWILELGGIGAISLGLVRATRG